MLISTGIINIDFYIIYTFIIWYIQSLGQYKFGTSGISETLSNDFEI